MDTNSNVIDVLSKVTSIKKDKVICCTIKVSNMTLIRLRDVLTEIGKIYKEILDRQTYVAVISGGFFKKNHAVMSIELLDDELNIAVYADEGIINQHTCEGAINEFRRAIKEYIRE